LGTRQKTNFSEKDKINAKDNKKEGETFANRLQATMLLRAGVKRGERPTKHDLLGVVAGGGYEGLARFLAQSKPSSNRLLGAGSRGRKTNGRRSKKKKGRMKR